MTMDKPAGINAALAAAQAELADPIRAKTMAVPGRPSRAYAGLDDLLQAVRPVLARHGIAISQAIVVLGEGVWALETRLLHAGGEVLTSHYPLDWKGGPQDQGSRITYARRYSLEAICGVAATSDDDAEAPQKTHNERPARPPTRSPPSSPRPAAHTAPPVERDTGSGASEGGQGWTPAQQHAFGALVKDAWPGAPSLADLDAYRVAHGRPTLAETPPLDRSRLITALKKLDTQHAIQEWLGKRDEQAGGDA